MNWDFFLFFYYREVKWGAFTCYTDSTSCSSQIFGHSSSSCAAFSTVEKRNMASALCLFLLVLLHPSRWFHLPSVSWSSCTRQWRARWGGARPRIRLPPRPTATSRAARPNREGQRGLFEQRDKHGVAGRQEQESVMLPVKSHCHIIFGSEATKQDSQVGHGVPLLTSDDRTGGDVGDSGTERRNTHTHTCFLSDYKGGGGVLLCSQRQRSQCHTFNSDVQLLSVRLPAVGEHTLPGPWVRGGHGIQVDGVCPLDSASLRPRPLHSGARGQACDLTLEHPIAARLQLHRGPGWHWQQTRNQWESIRGRAAMLRRRRNLLNTCA